MSVNPKQLFKANTPPWAQKAFQIFFYVTGIATVLTMTVPQIPAPIKVQVSGIVLESNLVLHAICNMFGIDVDQYNNTNIPTAAPGDQEMQNNKVTS